jgi:hypothetical protein
MIDIAVIASTPHLTDLSSLGNIDMALTHLVLTDHRQATYFAARSAAGIRVVVDNSAYELETVTGQGMTAGPVLQAARLIDATVVICHDVLYNGPATLTATRRFLAEAADFANPDQYVYMGVPQGTTRAEWLRCYHQLRELPGISMIGLSKLSVPRCFQAPIAEARLSCVDQLAGADRPLPVHLLGGDRSLPWELRQHRHRGHDGFIRSCDSSYAFWYAANHLPLDPVTGRAACDAPGKPDLENLTLDLPTLATAQATVAVLRAAAGLPATTDPEEIPWR